MAATFCSIRAGAKRHQIEPYAYVRDLLIAVSWDIVDLNSQLPDVWIAAHTDHVLNYRRDEAETAANARRRHRALRREKTTSPSP